MIIYYYKNYHIIQNDYLSTPPLLFINNAFIQILILKILGFLYDSPSTYTYSSIRQLKMIILKYLEFVSAIP